MFDSVEVTNENQDMAFNKIIEGMKNFRKGYNVHFHKDMTQEDKSAFLARVQVEFDKNKSL